MLESITLTLTQTLASLAGYVGDPNQRIYWLYLLSALIMGVGVLLLKKISLRQIMSPNIWWHKSARHDYAIFIINRLLKNFGIIPVLLVMAPIAISFSSWLEQQFGTAAFSALPSGFIIVSFTLLLFIIDDFTRFLLHYALHKIPLLWEFHKVHHSATVLTPMTIYRSHPIESLLYGARMVLSQGIAVGISYYLFGPTLSMLDILGANAFVFAFNIMGSNLRHSHIWLSWGTAFEKWFISPAQHQIHHSDKRIHIDCNFGSALAIWDRMCFSIIYANSVNHPNEINFGLGKSHHAHNSLLAIYWHPFYLAFIKPIKTLSNKVKR